MSGLSLCPQRHDFNVGENLKLRALKNILFHIEIRNLSTLGNNLDLLYIINKNKVLGTVHHQIVNRSIK